MVPYLLEKVASRIDRRTAEQKYQYKSHPQQQQQQRSNFSSKYGDAGADT